MGVFVYGAAVYGLFLGVFLYAMGFVENMGVPKSIDTGTPGPLIPALVVNAILLGLFAVQHAIMARPAFKRWWTRYCPKPAERSTFVLATCVCLILMFRYWRPIEGGLWHVESPALRGLAYAVSLCGFGLVLYASFCINHFDLFGLRQVYLHLRGVPYEPAPFVMPWLYRWVRNPLMLGFLIAFWVTPDMTYSHLMFAAMTTGYILIGVQLEERDLSEQLGEPYRQYRARTNMLLPWPRRREAPAEAVVMAS